MSVYVNIAKYLHTKNAYDKGIAFGIIYIWWQDVLPSNRQEAAVGVFMVMRLVTPRKTHYTPGKVTWALKMTLSKFGISSSKGLIGGPPVLGSSGWFWGYITNTISTCGFHFRMTPVWQGNVSFSVGITLGWVLDLRFLWQITWKTLDIKLVQVFPVLSYCLMANLELVNIEHRYSHAMLLTTQCKQKRSNNISQ